MVRTEADILVVKGQLQSHDAMRELGVLGIRFELNFPVSPHFRNKSYTIYFSLIQRVHIMGSAHTKALNLDSLRSISSLVCMQICMTKFMETEILEPMIWFEKKRQAREFGSERKKQNKTRRNVEKDKETLFLSW
ncbi:unnamed protein product [Sphenostylis stenocarpa]|uniref:Uncharacterized protein n=1 Tax=Sphenostylis stenocarpa TaxID=92480 RepID=A0AA86S0G4_9FABA|nr:unnamed protein product [Sphenostylis stenocarpa]